MPDHAAGACGARQRNAPIGGAANGTPLNIVMPFSCTPSSNPLSVGMAAADAADQRLARTSRTSIAPSAMKLPER